MEKFVKISKGRVARVTCEIVINKEELKAFEKEVVAENEGGEFSEYASKVLINGKPFCKAVTKDIVIMATEYAAEAITLTGDDWRHINVAINEVKEALRAEPYTLLEYYS